jgi:hypothetical protein
MIRISGYRGVTGSRVDEGQQGLGGEPELAAEYGAARTCRWCRAMTSSAGIGMTEVPCGASKGVTMTERVPEDDVERPAQRESLGDPSVDAVPADAGELELDDVERAAPGDRGARRDEFSGEPEPDDLR